MLIQIQKYQFKLVYQPGKQLILADAFSRAKLKNSEQRDGFEADLDAHICLIRSQINVSEQKLNNIKHKTEKDKTLSKLKDIILEGWQKNS